MLRRILQVGALFLLWVANLMLVASFWTNAIGLGFLGLLVGVVFGLPFVYLWFISDRLAFSRFDEHIRPTIERIARRRLPSKTQALPAPLVHPVLEDDALDLPVRVIEPEPAKKPALLGPVKVDVEVDEADRKAWEAKKAADVEYERLRDEIPGMTYEAVIDLIEHTDPRVRLAVVQHLRHMEDERIRERLMMALEDSNVVVRRAARLALDERNIG